MDHLNQGQEKLALYYFQTTDLWKKLCEEHILLFNLTMDEYFLLLSSDLEELEKKLHEKDEVIQIIKNLESIRQSLIQDLENDYQLNIHSVADLLKFMLKYEVESKEKHLFRFNGLLIDIIEKIQTQNKKNQLFINKALTTLADIRKEAFGEKNYHVYNRRGGKSGNVAK